MESVNPDEMTIAEMCDDYLNGTVRPLDNSPPIEINGRILHAIMGMVDEAGEMNGLAKGVIYYKKKLDMVNLLEEMGDMLWYWFLGVDEIAKVMKSSPKRVVQAIYDMNRAKLYHRYLCKGEYNEEGATVRDFEFERKVLESAMVGKFKAEKKRSSDGKKKKTQNSDT
jgi:hypothetical protein